MRVRDSDGAEGMGYTYTVHAERRGDPRRMIERYLARC